MELRLQTAETHSHYLPKERDPRVDEAQRIATTVNEMKVQNPEKGQGINDTLVDQLIASTLSLTAQPEHEREPINWTPAQRVVWRSSQMPLGRRHEIVESREINKEVNAFAVINAGRWLVECPLPGCNGAQYASVTDRRFWCVDCQNEAVNQKWIGVKWPENPNELELALLKRPKSAQNWLPGETTEDLANQDEEQKVKE
jgi:hypothetical protein